MILNVYEMIIIEKKLIKINIFAIFVRQLIDDTRLNFQLLSKT